MKFNVVFYNLLHHWSLFRFIRLGIGVFIIIEGIRTEMWMMFGMGVLFSLLPLLNMGSCATGNCAVPLKDEMKSLTDQEKRSSME